MDEGATSRLERVMERGFETLADLQRETNARLDQTNVRLGRVEAGLEVLGQRVGLIEEVLKDFAQQLVTLARAVKALSESQEDAIADLRRRVDALEQRDDS